MNIFLIVILLYPAILYYINIIYLKENRKKLYDFDRSETLTLLIFNTVCLFVGIGVVLIFCFLSLMATGDPGFKNYHYFIWFGIIVLTLIYYCLGFIYFIMKLLKLRKHHKGKTE